LAKLLAMSDGSPTSKMIQDDFDPSPGWRLRGFVMVVPAILCVILNLCLLLLFALIVPKLIRKYEIPLIRAWGRMPLALLGIKVEVRGSEYRDAPGAKLLLFNHINVFDLLVLATVWTKGSSVIYKAEFHKIPVMGRLLRFFNMIPVDRSDRAKALQSLNRAGEMIREQGRNVVMAPEGTRSGTGKLAAFKKGPFHLALQTRVPMVPMIQRGLATLAPNGTLFTRSGVVRVQYLPPIDPSDWQRESLAEHIDQVRAAFLQYCPDGTV
jgi:1-acyl-sn-glycerol-3-phosphate acyltransferase